LSETWSQARTYVRSGPVRVVEFRNDTTRPDQRQSLIGARAKFHYVDTDRTGPDQTKSADLSETRADRMLPPMISAVFLCRVSRRWTPCNRRLRRPTLGADKTEWHHATSDTWSTSTGQSDVVADARHRQVNSAQPRRRPLASVELATTKEVIYSVLETAYQHSRRKLSLMLATAYYSCPDNASSPM